MIPLGLSSNALARALNVTPSRINEIVRERRGISADTALRLARSSSDRAITFKQMCLLNEEDGRFGGI